MNFCQGTLVLAGLLLILSLSTEKNAKFNVMKLLLFLLLLLLFSLLLLFALYVQVESISLKGL